MAEAQSAAGVPLPPRADGVLVAAVRDCRREADLVAAALRAAGHRAAVDLGSPRARRALVEYARRSGFSCVLELSRQGASWLLEGAAIDVPAAALRRAASTGDAAALELPGREPAARRD